MSLNLATLVREAAGAQPDKPCLLVDGRVVTYRELDAMSARAAGGLRALGLGRGDKVAVQLGNGAVFVFVYFGVLRAGLTMVPMNPLLREQEVRHQLADSEVKALLTSSAHVEEIARAASGLLLFVLDGAALPVGAGALAELYDEQPFDDLVPTGSEDTAVLLYTSGTTGRPKGAELTHLQLWMNASTSGRSSASSPRTSRSRSCRSSTSTGSR